VTDAVTSEDDTRIRYRQDKGRLCIDVRLHSWRQFFDQRDPAPFRDRDLDDDAVAYIVASFHELDKSERAKLVLHIAEPRELSVGPEVFSQAIKAYFENELVMTRARRRQFFRLARTTLLIGAGFLGICYLAAQWVGTLGLGMTGGAIREGLTILGWVALWRPIDSFLYEWWPTQDALDVYDKLSRLPVETIYGTG
jgi:hypothetical protein